MRYFVRQLIPLTLFGLCPLVIFLCACSSISMKQSALSYPLPPEEKSEDLSGRDPVAIDHALEKKYQQNPSEPMRLLVRYQQALLWSSIDPAKSCALWLEIQGQPKFPLQRVARLHTMEVCPENRGKFPPLGEIVAATSEPWLQEALSRAALKRAERIGDKHWEIKLSIMMAKSEKLQTEKVKRLQRALSLAKEVGDAQGLSDADTALQMAAPRFLKTPPQSRYLEVAADHRQAREFSEARDWYRKVVDTDGFSDWEKLKALDGIRMTYKLGKNIEQFLKTTQEYSAFARRRFLLTGRAMLSKNASSSKTLLGKYLQTQITLARAVWTEHSPADASVILKKAESDLAGSGVSVAESVWIRSRIEEEAGHYPRTIRLLDTIDLAQLGDRDLRSKILWYRAWNLRKAKRLNDATASLEKLSKDESNTSLGARNHYWLGRTFADAGQSSRATNEYEWLIANDPTGWYGMLAYRELKRPIPTFVGLQTRLATADANTVGARLPSSVTEHTENSGQNSGQSSGQNAALMPEEKLLLEWLISAGETDLSRKFLDFATNDRRSGFDDGQLLSLLQLYARTGNYQTMFSRLYELPANTRTRLLESHPDLLFPQPWSQFVTVAAARYKVPTELIYSIMRQESSFNPMARSPADAFGLLQLIPEAAKQVEDVTKIHLASHEDLYLPELNIPLGAAFLRGLLNHWKESFIPSVASYNASEKAIAGWLKTRFHGDPTEFVEDVPYEETRNYIKLVTRNFIFYSRLNSTSPSIEFPERCLASLQDVKP